MIKFLLLYKNHDWKSSCFMWFSAAAATTAIWVVKLDHLICFQHTDHFAEQIFDGIEIWAVWWQIVN